DLERILAEQQADDDDGDDGAAAEAEATAEGHAASAARACIFDVVTAAKIVPFHGALPVSGYLTPTTVDRASTQLIDRARPACLEQPRQSAVGEDHSAGLASCAVVRFVLGVDDALYGRATDRTGLAILAVHRHLGPERGNLGRKARAGLVAET